MWWKTCLLLAALGLLLVLSLIALVRREQHVPLLGEIVYDDFGFAVLEHHEEARIGDVLPRGVFHVVRLEVRNHARRVDYRPDSHRAVVFDDQGVEYEVSPEGQRALDARSGERALKVQIAPGESHATELAFDVPKGRETLWLRISWGGKWLDVVDRLVCGSRDIALQP